MQVELMRLEHAAYEALLPPLLRDIAVALAAFLLFAGLGSRWSSRFALAGTARWAVGWAALVIAGLALSYALALPPLFRQLMGLAEGIKIGLSVLLIAPLAWAMGMRFPLGLAGSRPARSVVMRR